MQTFFQNGDEQVNGDGAPDLGAHGVGAGAIEGFDAQMLFDPFEEQFDLPAALIELDDGQSRHGEVVGQEDQRQTGFGIAIANAAQRVGIIAVRIEAGRQDGLVETQAGGFVHRPGVAPGAAEILFGAGDEESAMLMEPMESGEVEIAAIHNVERPGFPDQLVENVHIVDTARRDKALARRTPGRFRCHANFRATSVGQKPAREPVRKRAACGRGSCRDNGRHTCRTRIWAGSRGVGRRQCDLRS